MLGRGTPGCDSAHCSSTALMLFGGGVTREQHPLVHPQSTQRTHLCSHRAPVTPTHAHTEHPMHPLVHTQSTPSTHVQAPAWCPTSPEKGHWDFEPPARKRQRCPRCLTVGGEQARGRRRQPLPGPRAPTLGSAGEMKVSGFAGVLGLGTGGPGTRRVGAPETAGLCLQHGCETPTRHPGHGQGHGAPSLAEDEEGPAGPLCPVSPASPGDEQGCPFPPGEPRGCPGRDELSSGCPDTQMAKVALSSGHQAIQPPRPPRRGTGRATGGGTSL